MSDWRDQQLLKAFHLMSSNEQELFLETALVQTEGRGKKIVNLTLISRSPASSDDDSRSFERQA